MSEVQASSVGGHVTVWFGGQSREQRRTHALASLRQAVWEASLFLDREQVVRFVDDVLREVESDEP